jgi:hypothetical protein
MPGESPAVFRRRTAPDRERSDLPLPGRAALLVFDPADGDQAGRGPRRAAQARPRSKVVPSWNSDCAKTCARTGDFSRMHPMPQLRLTCRTTSMRAWWCSASTIRTARKRATPPRALRQGDPSNRAGSRRACIRNTLVFLAIDKTRLQDLDEAVRGRYLAWESILAEKDSSDLSPHQVTQAEDSAAHADGAVTARLPETYQWLLVPVQTSPQAPSTWESIRLSGYRRAGRARQQEAAN